MRNSRSIWLYKLKTAGRDVKVFFGYLVDLVMKLTISPLRSPNRVLSTRPRDRVCTCLEVLGYQCHCVAETIAKLRSTVQYEEPRLGYCFALHKYVRYSINIHRSPTCSTFTYSYLYESFTLVLPL